MNGRRPHRRRNMVAEMEVDDDPLLDARSLYKETLQKPLVPRFGRRTDPPRPTTSTASAVSSPADTPPPAASDPALMLTLNSRTRQLHLNKVQKSMIWQARRAQYQRTLEKIVRCLQSHLLPLEKCLLLLVIHEKEVIPKRLRLRDDTYDDIFHLFYATAHLSSTPISGASTQQRYQTMHALVEGSTAMGTPQQAAVEEEAEMVRAGEEAAHHVSSVPVELASRAAATMTLTSEETIQQMWVMYRYMVDSGTDPTPRIVQHLMGLLERRARRVGLGQTHPDAAPPQPGLAVLEAKAHSLMMDLDRFHHCPTSYTLNSYIYLCQVCGVMHLALARVTDYLSRHERQPTASLYTRLLHGFLHQPLKPKASKSSTEEDDEEVEEEEDTRAADALAVMTTMQSTPISQALLHEMMQVGRFSRDPLSALTIYRAVVCRRGRRDGMYHPSAAVSAGLIRPTLHTFSILIEAILRSFDIAAVEDHAEEVEGGGGRGNNSSTAAMGPPTTTALPPPPSQQQQKKRRRKQAEYLRFVLEEMRRHRIKGNKAVLNKVLECLRRSGEVKALQRLRDAMLASGVFVFDEYRKI